MADDGYESWRCPTWVAVIGSDVHGFAEVEDEERKSGNWRRGSKMGPGRGAGLWPEPWKYLIPGGVRLRGAPSLLEPVKSAVETARYGGPSSAFSVY